MKLFDRVFVIGVGGTGSWLFPPLAQFLRLQMREKYIQFFAIDGDNFEKKNMERQMMSPDDIGKNKAVAAIDKCFQRGIFGEEDTELVFAIDDYVTKESFSELLRDAEFPLIIASVDNYASRRAIIDAVVETCEDFFFITPGNSDVQEDAPRGQACWFGSIEGQKYGLNPVEYDVDLQNPQDAIPRKGTCMNLVESHPQIISANFAGASRVLDIVQALVRQKLNPNHSQVYFNCDTQKSTVS